MNISIIFIMPWDSQFLLEPNKESLSFIHSVDIIEPLCARPYDKG